MPNYPKIIAEIRRRAGLSQQKLAEELGVSLPTVNRWEKGKTDPDPARLAALVDLTRRWGGEYEDLLRALEGEDVEIETGEALPEKPGRRGRKSKAPTKAEGDGAAYGENGHVMDTRAMEGMLWKAACSIRGEKDAPKFKDYILPLLFAKRLNDVFEDEIARLTHDFGDEETALEVLDADHSLVRFFIPEEARWPVISGRKPHKWPRGKEPKTLGEHLTTAMRNIANSNESLSGVIDIMDFNETRNGVREISDDALKRIIELFSDPRYRLGLKDVEPDFLGRAYEYLLRKFAEGSGQSAGEFFTPREVGWLMAQILNPQEGETVYDPCCGSAGLLVKCELTLVERLKAEGKKLSKPLRLHGQELIGPTFGIARMNTVLHDMEAEIVRGDSMRNPKFTEDSHLQQFDIVTTNPMWNQNVFDPDKDYEGDRYDRFSERGGFAPKNSADWAWLQHVVASLSENGRAAVVMDTGAASRGSGSRQENKEKKIRQWFVENDLVEAVILLPENLFYNTTAAGLIIVLNRNKPTARKDKVLLINGSGEFEKGRPKNYLTDEGIKRIADAIASGESIDGFASVTSNTSIAEKDYNLSPSAFVSNGLTNTHRDLDVVIPELLSLQVEAHRLDNEVNAILTSLGLVHGGNQ